MTAAGLTVAYRTARPVSAVAFDEKGRLLVAEDGGDGLPGQTALPATAELVRVERGVPVLFAHLPYPTVTGMAASATSVAVSGTGANPGLLLDPDGRVRGSFKPGMRVQAFMPGEAGLLVIADTRFGVLALPASQASEPTWVPFLAGTHIVSVSPH